MAQPPSPISLTVGTQPSKKHTSLGLPLLGTSTTSLGSSRSFSTASSHINTVMPPPPPSGPLHPQTSAPPSSGPHLSSNLGPGQPFLGGPDITGLSLGGSPVDHPPTKGSIPTIPAHTQQLSHTQEALEFLRNALHHTGSSLWPFGQARRDKLKLRCFLLTYLAYGVTFWLHKPISVIKIDLAREMNVEVPALGWLDTSFLLPLALGQIFFSHFGEKVGPRKMIALGLSGSALAMFSFGNWDSYFMHVFLLILSGAAQSQVFPYCIKALGLWFPTQEHRHSVFGVWGTTAFLGGLLGTSFSVAFKSQFGWHSVFVLPSILAMTVAFVLYNMLRQPSGATTAPLNNMAMHQNSLINANGSGLSSVTVGFSDPSPLEINTLSSKPFLPSSQVIVQADTYLARPEGYAVREVSEADAILITSPPKVRVLHFWELCQMAAVRDVAISYFCVNGLRYALYMWLPLFLHAEVGYSVDTAGWISVAFELGGLLGSPIVGVLTDRMLQGRKMAVTQVSLAISALALLGFYFTTHWGIPTSFFFLMLVGAGNGGTDAVLSGSVGVELGEKEDAIGSVAGFIGGFGILGAVVEGPVIGFAAHYGGAVGVFVVMAVFAVGPVLVVGRSFLIERLAKPKAIVKREEMKQ